LRLSAYLQGEFARVLGHLNRGGKFEVRQTEVAPGHWEMTALNVEMKGKALFFKTIGVQEPKPTATSIEYRMI